MLPGKERKRAVSQEEGGCLDAAGPLEGVGSEKEAEEQGGEGGEDEGGESKLIGKEVQQPTGETAPHH